MAGVTPNRHRLSRHLVLDQAASSLEAFNRVASEVVVVGLEVTSEVILEEDLEVMIAVVSAAVAGLDIKTVGGLVAGVAFRALLHRVRLADLEVEVEVGTALAAMTIDEMAMEVTEVTEVTEVRAEVGMGEAIVVSLAATESLWPHEIEATKSVIDTRAADVMTTTAQESDTTRTTTRIPGRDDATESGGPLSTFHHPLYYHIEGLWVGMAIVSAYCPLPPAPKFTSCSHG